MPREPRGDVERFGEIFRRNPFIGQGRDHLVHRAAVVVVVGVNRLEMQVVRESAIPLLVAEVGIANLGGAHRHEFQGRHGRSPFKN